MNREIKFRAWIDDPGILDLCGGKPFYAYQGTVDLETIQSFMFHWGDRQLEQFTGLKDRNGREIYEGDIISWVEDGVPGDPAVGQMYFKEVVEFKNGAFVVKGCSFDDYFGGEVLYRVIGNRWENPELLKP